jgi:hypothetical protein
VEALVTGGPYTGPVTRRWAGVSGGDGGQGFETVGVGVAVLGADEQVDDLEVAPPEGSLSQRVDEELVGVVIVYFPDPDVGD